MDIVDKIIQANIDLHDLVMEKWLSQDLFSIKWWGVLGFIVLSYVICFWKMDKARLRDAILYGSLVSVFTVIIDIFGCNFTRWTYTAFLLPMVPSIFVYDITALPLYYMLIFQYTRSWKSYILWIVGASAFLGFVLTPVMVKLDLIRLVDWKNVYAFLAFIGIGITAKVAMSIILFVEGKYLMRQ